MRRFKQVDVFTAVPYKGNALAVVFDADGLSTEEMQRFANWTNLSETTFIHSPTDAAADYRVRIFTPDIELPFAGHPTIGTCHSWLEAGGQPAGDGVVQECAAGLIPLRRDGGRLAFAAPPLTRSGPVDEPDVERVCRVLQIDRSAVVDAQWADNGPGWIAVMLESAEAVIALEPDFNAEESYDIGVVGPHPLGLVGAISADQKPADESDGCAIEVRAFFRSGGQPVEDPVTGSLNAALAQWLVPARVLQAPYIASQGIAVGRAGRVHIDISEDQTWVGGDAVTCIDGHVDV